MIRRCAWCHRFLGFKQGRGITDGICPPCQRKVLDELEYEDLDHHPGGAIAVVTACSLFWIAVAVTIWFAWRQG